MESQEEPLQSLLKNLKTYVNPFHRAARNMATWAEAPVSIVHGLLSSKEKGKECLIEFIEKRLLSPEKEIYKPNKRGNIQITIEKKKKLRDIYFEGRSAGFRTLCCELCCQKRSF